MHNKISFTEAICEATRQSMEADPKIFVMGLGVSYPNGADGTTKGLKEKFPERILDVPVSEACITGTGVGAAIRGLRPLIHHGRVEFAFLGTDQIVTQAAKWNYMLGGDNPVPAVFRLAVGRQWGNGPQHTQGMYSLYGSVPGLKVVVPSGPARAKGLLASALKDNNPVVYMEPRWLYGTRENVNSSLYFDDLSCASVLREGTDFSIVTYGDGILEALHAEKILRAELGIHVEIIDLVSLHPIDYRTVYKSIRKTGRLLVFDTTNSSFCVGSEVIAKCCQNEFRSLKSGPISISCPDVPCPTSTSLTEVFYPNYQNIVKEVCRALGVPSSPLPKPSFEDLHYAPKFDFNEAS